MNIFFFFWGGGNQRGMWHHMWALLMYKFLALSIYRFVLKRIICLRNSIHTYSAFVLLFGIQIRWSGLIYLRNQSFSTSKSQNRVWIQHFWLKIGLVICWMIFITNLKWIIIWPFHWFWPNHVKLLNYSIQHCKTDYVDSICSQIESKRALYTQTCSLPDCVKETSCNKPSQNSTRYISKKIFSSLNAILARPILEPIK